MNISQTVPSIKFNKEYFKIGEPYYIEADGEQYFALLQEFEEAGLNFGRVYMPGTYDNETYAHIIDSRISLDEFSSGQVIIRAMKIVTEESEGK